MRALLAATLGALIVCGASASAQDVALQPYQPHPVSVPKDASYLRPDGSIYIVGDDATDEMMAKLDELFVKTHPGFKFTLLLKGSSTGIGGLTSGVSAMAPMGRPGWLSDLSAFKEAYGYPATDIHIGYDAYTHDKHKSPPALYVNAQNPLAGLTVAQAARIFTSGGGKGDITHVMLLGPLIKHGVDISKLTIVEIGGSGGRLRALLSGRVQAVPIHFDQAAEVLKQGPYKVFFQPWEFYRLWVNEVWACSGAWLKKPGNARAAVDVLKATTLAFRRANRDFNWYLQMYRKYATIPKANETTEETLKPLWTKLVNDVRAWPDYNILTASDMKDLLPIYKAAGDIQGTLKIRDIMDTSYAEQAMKELRKQGL